jgi:hypothetical protein
LCACDARAFAVDKAGQNIVVRGQCGKSGAVINAADTARKCRRKCPLVDDEICAGEIDVIVSAG